MEAPNENPAADAAKDQPAAPAEDAKANDDPKADENSPALKVPIKNPLDSEPYSPSD